MVPLAAAAPVDGRYQWGHSTDAGVVGDAIENVEVDSMKRVMPPVWDSVKRVAGKKEFTRILKAQAIIRKKKKNRGLKNNRIMKGVAGGRARGPKIKKEALAKIDRSPKEGSALIAIGFIWSIGAMLACWLKPDEKGVPFMSAERPRVRAWLTEA
jgi:hypothetical protein